MLNINPRRMTHQINPIENKAPSATIAISLRNLLGLFPDFSYLWLIGQIY